MAKLCSMRTNDISVRQQARVRAGGISLRPWHRNWSGNLSPA